MRAIRCHDRRDGAGESDEPGWALLAHMERGCEVVVAGGSEGSGNPHHPRITAGALPAETISW